MAYTNAQLVRREIGDPGIPARNVSSGDGSSIEFYLSAPPISDTSEEVRVGGVLYTEVASNPAASQYTLDDLSGRLVFGTPPSNGDGNIVVTYLAVQATDADIEEALRLVGLDPDATADLGPSTQLLTAAWIACGWTSAFYASAVDFSADGQSVSRSALSTQYAERAKAIAARIPGTAASGASDLLTSAPVTRIDGYSRRGEYDSRDIGPVDPVEGRRKLIGLP